MFDEEFIASLRGSTFINESNKLTTEQVSAAEEKWGIVFPPSYREFLIQVGAGEDLILWDGSQDYLIECLYKKVFNSLCAMISWGVWNTVAWGEQPESESEDGNLTEAEIKRFIEKLCSQSRKIIPVSLRHFTLCAKRYNTLSETAKADRKKEREQIFEVFRLQQSELRNNIENDKIIADDESKSESERDEAEERIFLSRRQNQKLTEQVEYYKFPRESYGNSEAVMSFAISDELFDVQDIMMQGSNFHNFLRYKVLNVPFNEVNPDEEYNSLRSEPLWGLFVN